MRDYQKQCERARVGVWLALEAASAKAGLFGRDSEARFWDGLRELIASRYPAVEREGYGVAGSV